MISRWSLWSRGPPRGHLAAIGCSGFDVEFNNYNIFGDDPMSLTSLLQGVPKLWAKGRLPFTHILQTFNKLTLIDQSRHTLLLTKDTPLFKSQKGY